MDSPLRPSLPRSEDPIPPLTQKNPTPPRSSLRDAEDPIPQNNPLASPTAGRREGAMGSPLRVRDSEDRIPQRSQLVLQLMDSPARSPLRDAADQIPPKNQLVSQFAREGALDSLVRSPLREAAAGRREGAVGSPLRQPLRDAGGPIPLPPPSQDTQEKPASPAAEAPAVAVAHRQLRDQLAVVTKAERGGGGGGGRVAARGEGYGFGPLDGERGSSRVVSGIVRRKAVRRTEVGLRVLALVLSLVAFSVMVADKTMGWAGDSWDRYKEYRYLVSMNVIAFVYSTFQVSAHVHYMIKKRHIIRLPIRCYFDFLMDQVLAYLLISASSSAATRNHSWVSMFGGDDFTKMANGSIAMSFLAFAAFVLSSLISVYSLFRWNP